MDHPIPTSEAPDKRLNNSSVRADQRMCEPKSSPHDVSRSNLFLTVNTEQVDLEGFVEELDVICIQCAFIGVDSFGHCRQDLSRCELQQGRFTKSYELSIPADHAY